MTDLVRVWIVPFDVPPDTEARCRDVLNEDERARAATFQSPRDEQRFAVAHGAVRLLAGRELNAPPRTLSFAFGRYGKPRLAAPWSSLHTSLSHSGDLIAVAISASRPAGVDIQQVEPGLDKAALAARFFPPDEAGYVADDLPPGEGADRFAHLWARKEAAVKAVGGRLWPNLGTAVLGRDVVSIAEPAGSHRVADVAAPPGFRAAVALAGAAPFAVESGHWPDA